jgi:predicted RNase H-like nuclease (RuvC/YqgF family)
VNDRDTFNSVLESYHGVYDSIQQNITQVIQNPDSFHQHKTINITRQDPRAAEEIMKLRNVAADQHRIISDLQRKLMDASTTEEKEVVIHELQQQLHRQVRFVQESETCIQLLEDELAKAHEEISLQEKTLSETSALSEENKQIKSTLHSFTLESKGLISNLHELEQENDSLKQHMRQAVPTAATQANAKHPSSEVKKIQSELTDLKKQYAELEERYLDLKLGQ